MLLNRIIHSLTDRPRLWSPPRSLPLYEIWIFAFNLISQSLISFIVQLPTVHVQYYRYLIFWYSTAIHLRV